MALTHTIWQNCLAGKEIEMINENAISNLLIDVDYLEDALKRIGRSHLATVFSELRSVSGIYSRAPNLPYLASPDCIYPSQQRFTGVPRPGQPTNIIPCSQTETITDLTGETGPIWIAPTRACCKRIRGTKT